MDDFFENGFRLIVSLLNEEEQHPSYDVARAFRLGFERQVIAVRDFHAPAVAQLREFVDLVASRRGSCKVIVHCQGGTGRTGTMAAAYWIARGQSAAAAIKRVRDVRPGAVEVDEQRAALDAFEALRRPPGSAHP
jgi:protein-tyrosine phosphatase